MLYAYREQDRVAKSYFIEQIQNKQRSVLIYISYMYEYFVRMYVHVTCVCLLPAEGGSDPLELELGMVVSRRVGAGASAKTAIALNYRAILQARNTNLKMYVYEFLPECMNTMDAGGGRHPVPWNWSYEWL